MSEITPQLTDGVAYIGEETHNGVKCAKFELLAGGYDFEVTDNTVTASLQEEYFSDTAQDTECVKITAKYTSDGVLLNTTVENIKVSEIEAVQNTATKKVFYWESLESMKPVKISE